MLALPAKQGDDPQSVTTGKLRTAGRNIEMFDVSWNNPARVIIYDLSDRVARILE